MDENLINLLSELRDLLKETDEYKSLIAAEKTMENSDEVMVLSYKKDMALVHYEDTLKHYPKNSKEVLESEKNLAETVYNLNNHELVKDYKTKLNAYNKLLEDVKNRIFKGIK